MPYGNTSDWYWITIVLPIAIAQQVHWVEEEDSFYLVAAGTSEYERRSSVTDCEDVSYVVSPFLPSTVRRYD